MGIKFLDSLTTKWTVLPTVAKGGVGDTQVSLDVGAAGTIGSEGDVLTTHGGQAAWQPPDPGFVWPGTTPGDMVMQGNLYDRARGIVPTSTAANNNLATDGDDSTATSLTGATNHMTWTIDLGVARHITSARVLFQVNGGGNGYNASAQTYYSDDNATWSACGPSGGWGDARALQTWQPAWDVGSHRYWRLDLAAAAYTPTLNTWSLFDANASGAIVRLPVGAPGQFLGVGGSPAEPQWQNLPADADTLAALTDVDLAGLADGNSLIWDATEAKWEPSAAPLVDPTGTPGDMLYRVGVSSTDLAAGKGGTVSQAYSGGVAQMTDGNDSTYWDTNNGQTNAYAVVDLGSAQWAGATRVLQDRSGAGQVTSFKLSSSNDNVTFTDRVTFNPAGVDTGTVTFSAVKARYWKLTILAFTAGNGSLLGTWQIFAAGVIALPIGAEAQALTVVSGEPAWAAPLRVLAAATVGVAQSTIAHGLGRAPTVVILLPTSAGQIWQSAAPDATNIYLTADAAGRTCIPNVA